MLSKTDIWYTEYIEKVSRVYVEVHTDAATEVAAVRRAVADDADHAQVTAAVFAAATGAAIEAANGAEYAAESGAGTGSASASGAGGAVKETCGEQCIKHIYAKRAILLSTGFCENITTVHIYVLAISISV